MFQKRGWELGAGDLWVRFHTNLKGWIRIPQPYSSATWPSLERWNNEVERT